MPEESANNKELRSRYFFPNAWKSYLILAIGILMTLYATYYTKRDIDMQTSDELRKVCSDIHTKITARLNSHALLLRSGASFFAASDSITRDNWHVFYRNNRLEKNLPGIQGLGFSLIISKNKLDQHTKHIRSEGFPHYSIRPAGQRAIYTSIVYIEPFADRNLRAFGYDMYSEPIRRRAMEQSRDLNIASLSGKVILVQETDKDMQAGTLMYVPVYKNGMPANTTQERRAAIIGWVYSPYRMHDLMAGILGRWDLNDENKIRMQIYDDGHITPDALLFDSQSRDLHTDSAPAELTVMLPIDFNGKKWVLMFSRTAQHFSFQHSKVLTVFFCGQIISILLFSLSLSLANTRIRAQLMANRLAAELRESERQFYLFMDYLPAIVFLKDSEGKALFVNKYMDKAVGASQWLGKNMAEVIPGELGSRLLADDMRVMQTGYEKIEECIMQSDGELHHYETQKFIIPRQGQDPYIGGISLDITERIFAEHALKLKQFALDNSGDTIMWISPDSRIIDCNEAACRLLGYSREELMQLSITAIDPNYTAENWADHFNELRQDTMLKFETQQRASNGLLIPVEVTANFIKFDDKELNCAFIRDITERKRVLKLLNEQNEEVQSMNERLVALNADKDRFISILAHDLKSPFTAILGFLELLSDNVRTFDTDTIERHINTVRSASLHTYKLLENILIWARSQAGRIPFQPAEFSLSQACSDVISKLKMPAERKSIALLNTIDTDANIVADENMIHTVILNLVSNAIKFTNNGGTIEISVSYDACNATITVSDTGVGIEPAVLNKLFDLTQIVTTAGTANETGTGFGLLLCKDFITKHGGKIWAESEYGHGSRFKFSIPTNSHKTV